MNEELATKYVQLMQKYPYLFSLMETMQYFQGKYTPDEIMQELGREMIYVYAELNSGAGEEISDFLLSALNSEMSEEENKKVDNLLSFLKDK